MESASRDCASSENKSPVREESGPSAGGPKKRQQHSHTGSQREEFLVALVRLGTVAEAAKEVGLNRSTCQKWANAAGIRRQRKYTQADKDQFHAVVDRTGSIVVAARELGLNTSTAYSWAGRVNPAAGKPRTTRTVVSSPQQRHLPAVIDEFLSVLQQVGSVSAAAGQLGLNRSTCSNWANDAGMVSTRTRRTSKKRAEYLRLRKAGSCRREAALAAGASRQSSYQWDRQQAAEDKGPVYPDTPDPAYKQEVATTFAEPSVRDAEAPASPTPLAVSGPPTPPVLDQESLEQVISARYLSLHERELIADSMRAIGRTLGRSPGSVSREIGRNSHPVLGYRPYGAHRGPGATQGQ